MVCKLQGKSHNQVIALDVPIKHLTSMGTAHIRYSEKEVFIVD